MSTTSRLPLGELHAVLDEFGAVDPIYLSTVEKQEALVEYARARARLDAAQLRLLAASGDVADATGARSTATWLADKTRDAHGGVRRSARLAAALEGRCRLVADALAAGAVNTAQAHVITHALDALPRELDQVLQENAEAHLVAKAAEFDPRELARLGQRVLEVIAPDVADEAEYQRLLEEERRARAATKLYFRPRGDGSTDVNARVPDHVANRLRTYLDGYTSPRGRALSEVDDLPLSRRRGEAFCAMLENLPASGLPRQGGAATTVTVTIDLATLLKDFRDVGVATTSTGDRITAGQARRMACTAGIIPFVMSGKSVIHDQGRSKRLFSDALRVALNLLFPECTTVGCSIPAAWCEAHHKVPWSRGGKTRLEDGTLLCPFHHHRAHDPGWIACHHPNGTTTFTRRSDIHPEPDSALRSASIRRVRARQTRMPPRTGMLGPEFRPACRPRGSHRSGGEEDVAGMVGRRGGGWVLGEPGRAEAAAGRE